MMETTKSNDDDSVHLPGSQVSVKDTPGDGDDSIKPPAEYECLCPGVTQATRRKVATPIVFVAEYSAFILLLMCTDVYLLPVITTLEKRFGFSSSRTGTLLSVKEATYVFFVLVVSHFGRHGNKPLIVGVMGLLGALAGYLAVLPHFLFPLPHLNQIDLQDAYLCLTDKAMNVSMGGEECSDNEAAFNPAAYAFFIAYSMILGLAHTAMLALVPAQIDEFGLPHKTPFYLGIISAFGPIGPVIGFGAAGIFTDIHHDLKDPGYGNDDVRWIGAWWIGYLLFPTLLLIASILLILFPFKRPTPTTSGNINKEKGLSKIWKTVKGVGQAFKRLFTNRIYIAIMVNWVFGFYLFTGYMTFLPKYMEIQFGLPASTVNYLIGVAVALVSAVGAFLGGLFQSKCSLGLREMVGLMTAMNAILTLLLFAGMFISCPQPSIIGIHLPVNGSCSAGCDCADDYFPVCGGDGATYRSPCVAGCTHFTESQEYSECSCTLNTTSMSNSLDNNGVAIGYESDVMMGRATSGFCDRGCDMYILFTVIISLGCFAQSFASVAYTVSVMRIVGEDDKALALGLGGALTSIFTFAPGPVIFGALVDMACVYKKETCDAEAACEVYDGTMLRYLLHGVILVTQVLSEIALIYALVHTFKLPSEQETSSPEGEKDDARNPEDATEMSNHASMKT